MSKATSPNYDERKAGSPVDILVFHYTGMETATAALARLRDPTARVSAHYLIYEDGHIDALVDERYRAWHAGVSYWRGETDVNGCSVGVELVNPGHEFGYRPYPDIQMAAAAELAQDILNRHPIPARNVVGHSDVAPARKIDPGEFFDWRSFAEKGIGLWPEEADILDMDPVRLARILADFGYDPSDFATAVKAFQRHFRPARVNGRIDPETARRMVGLTALVV